MEKKLPNIFVNTNAKKINANNKNLFYSLDEFQDEKKHFNNSLDPLFSIKISKKINDIFSSSRFVYKVKVLLTTKSEGTTKETLISKTSDGLLTLSNKKIKYEDIIDIKVI